MKKFTKLLLLFLFSFTGFAQLSLEGFEGTTGPDALPATNWTLGTGNWAVFDNGVGLAKRWTVNTTTGTIYNGTQTAFVDRENIGQNNTSEDYLATPLVTVPANGQLRFWTRLGYNGDAGAKLQIKVAPSTAPSQTNVASYTTIQEWTETSLVTTYNVYEEKVVDLSAYAGTQVYVAFVMKFTQPSTTLSGDRWYVDDVKIIAQCLAPTNLTATNVTNNSASLSWNPNGSNSWEIEVVPSTSTPTGTGTVYNGTLPYIASGLTSNTTYNYYVRALCSQGNSIWAGPFSFSTTTPGISCTNPINITSLPYSTTNNTSNFSDNPSIEGSPGSSCGSTSSYLNGNDVVYSYTAPATGIINVQMTPTATYSGIFVYSSCANIGVSCLAGVANSNTNIRNFDLNVTAGQTYYFVISTWAAPQTTGYTLNIQQVNCAPPAALTASGMTMTTANLSWSNPSGATSWQVAVQAAGSSVPTGAGATANTNTNYLANGLTAGTAYQYWVRADCGNGTFSAWSGPFLFNTLLCNTGCTYSFIVKDSFGDGWNGNTISIKQNGVTIATLTGPTTANGQNPITVPVVLCPGTFDVFWNAGGSFPTEVGITVVDPFGEQLYQHNPGTSLQNTLLYSGTVTCIPPTCPKPTNIQISGITQNSATVSWTNNSSATSWEIILQPTTAPAPTATSTGTIVTQNPYTFNNLPSGTSYSVYIRAICGANDLSTWSGPVNFTTTIANDNCANAINVPVNSGITCAQTVAGTVIGATASPEGNTCTGTDDDDVWFQFTATSTTHIISLDNVTGSTTDLFHVLYTGTCGNLTQLYCSDPNQSTANNLVVGQTYFIRVYTWTATANQTSAFTVCIGTPPPPISTSTTQYTVNQLVTDVLVNSPCATITNITSSTGTNFGSTNGIGYFNKNGSNFPFNDGIILCSGNANNAPGPNSTILSDGVTGWPGDTQLEATILAATGNAMNSKNASKLEFDFIPIDDNLSFNFIFASEEYGTFQCAYSDAFAFYLTDLTTNVTTNLALVPNTTSPISVVTIRNQLYNTGCASVNPQYFDKYYQLPQGLNPLGAPINYNGHTVPMTASSIVIPGHQYHIKLVVADRSDTAYDSAVFIEGDSFNIGQVNLGSDFLVSNGNAICPDATTTINSGLDPTAYTFTWMLGTNVIPNATGPNLTVNQPGVYTINATYNNTTCTASDSITVEYFAPIVLGTPNNLVACSNTGYSSFNLTSNNASVLGTLSATTYTVSYFASLADAQANTNALPATYTNTVQYQQTIWARVANSAGCFAISQFNLIVTDLITPTFTIPAPICPGSTAPVLPTTSLNGITGQWNPSTVSNTASGQYTFTPNAGQCAEPVVMNITVYSDCNFGSHASAVWLTNCATSNFYNTIGSGTDIIGPASNIFTNADLGTYVQNSGALKLRGAEVKTFKSTTANVCAANLYYRIYLQSSTPGSFSVMNLPFFDNCNSGTFPSGGPCNTGDQKWQKVLSDSQSPIDLTAFAPGNYMLEVYYDVNGDYNSTSQCDDTIIINNGGANFIASFKIQLNPSYTSTNPSACNSTDGSIKISGLASLTTYSVTYTNGATTVGPLNLVSNANGEIILSNLGAGNYSNFIVSANSCTYTNSNTITLSIPNAPVVSVNSPTVCQGQQATLTATPATTGNYLYTWTVPTGVTSPGNVNSFTTTVAGTYTVTITNIDTQCTSIAAIATVTVHSLPTVTVANQTICQGDNATLTAVTGSSTYNYSWTVPTGATNPGNVASFTTNVAGNYSVIVTDTATSCTNTANATVTINSLPIVTINNLTICEGSSGIILANVTSSGTYSYNWTVPAGVTNPGNVSSLSTSVAGNYQVVVTNTVTNCTTTVSSTVTILPLPVVTVNNPSICAGTPATVTATTTVTGNYTYAWTVPSGVTNPGSVASFTTTTPGTYTVVVTTVNGSCSSNPASGVVIQNNPPVATVNSPQVCQGTNATVSVTIGSGNYTYAWTVPTGATSPGNVNSFSTNMAGSYSVTITDNVTGCSTTLTSNVTIIAKPTVSVNTPTVCAGSNSTITATPNGSSTYTYTWTVPTGVNNPGNVASFATNVAGVYSVQITDTATGCTSNAVQSTLVLNALPEFELLGGCDGTQYVLSVENASFNTNGATYTWLSSTNTNIGQTSSVVVSNTGIYTCTVTDANGCSQTKNITVSTINCGVQKGISPNGDGKNEFFDLRGMGVSQLHIYNRYGTKVYAKSNYNNEWIGQSDKGDELPDGTYYYVIEYNSGGAAKTGWIYINREIK